MHRIRDSLMLAIKFRYLFIFVSTAVVAKKLVARYAFSFLELYFYLNT